MPRTFSVPVFWSKLNGFWFLFSQVFAVQALKLLHTADLFIVRYFLVCFLFLAKQYIKIHKKSDFTFIRRQLKLNCNFMDCVSESGCCCQRKQRILKHIYFNLNEEQIQMFKTKIAFKQLPSFQYISTYLNSLETLFHFNKQKQIRPSLVLQS